jgi:two-component system, OmpR family, KDP operon response regulator KdpE
MSHRPRVIVADSDPGIRRLLRRHFTGAGYAVTTTETEQALMEQFRRLTPDLVIVSIEAAGPGAQDVVRRIRTVSAAPMLALMPSDSQSTLGGVLDSGADDCMHEPFLLEELAARARRLLHRSSALGGPHSLTTILGRIDVDPLARTARRDGKDLALTRKEFDLLLVLLNAKGETMSHQQIIGKVWGSAYDNARQNLRRVVSSLRRKVEPYPEAPAHIISVRGGGYRLEG